MAKPRDKGLAENAVLQVERWVLAPLCKERFFSAYELNQAIDKRLIWLNDRERTNQALSRRVVFEQQETSTLQPLPADPFDYLEVKRAKVHIDYHVAFQQHHYTVSPTPTPVRSSSSGPASV